ncbi:MAG: Uma2 family endonuclease, partial [Microcoleaceae cyanobacterium]
MNAQILTEEIIDSPKSLTLYGVSWDKFKAIEFALDGISNVQLVYLDGIIDIMAPLSAEHEDAKSVIRQL